MTSFKEAPALVEAELRRLMEARRARIPEKLYDSMCYSLFAGGKRLRPFLVMAGAEAVGGDSRSAMPTAAAFEIIHTYTLIHDDLPAMDDDDLRRGMPTNHIKFGDATAILAGDGLLTLAFEAITEDPAEGKPVPPAIMAEVIRRVAIAVGAEGTVGGQQVDIESEGKEGDMETLEYIHTRKTGAMITAAVEVGGLIGGGALPDIAALASYGQKVGHAFQVVDDILDVTGSTEELGKPVGSDEGLNKMTYPALIGLEESRKLAKRMVEEAIAALEPLSGQTESLAWLARFIEERTH